MELHNAHLERMDHWYGRGAVIGLIIGIALGPGLRMDEGLFSLLLSVTMILIVFGGGGSAVGLAIVTLVYSLPPFRSRSLHDATSRAREFVARESGRKLVWNFPSYIRWCDPATQSEAPREIDIRAEVAAANLIQFSDLPIDSYFTRRNDQRPLRKLSVDTYIVDQVTYGADRGEWVSLVSDGDRGS